MDNTALSSTSVATKRCTKCGQELTLDNFYRRSESPDGLQNNCKACQKESSRDSKRNQRVSALNVKGAADSRLAEFTPRELIEELRSRGYRGELQYTYTIKV